MECTISGSFAATTPLESVTLYREQSMVARLQYRQPSAAWLRAVMHNIGPIHHGFSFNVWNGGAGDAENQTFTIEARDCAGGSSSFPIQCIVDDSRPDELRIVCDQGDTLVELPTEPPVVLRLEQAFIDNGLLHISGWVVARSLLSRAEVRVGNRYIPVRLGERRDDAVQRYPRYPGAGEAGFTAAIRLAEQPWPSLVEVRGTSADGAEYRGVFPVENSLPVMSNLRTAANTAKQTARPAVVIYVEYPTIENEVAVLNGRPQFELAGWAASREPIERLDAFVDAKFAGNPTFGLVRSDVARTFPQWPHAGKSGFTLRLNEQDFPRSPTTITLEAHLASGKKVSGEFELWFEDQPDSPAETDEVLDQMTSDLSIWQFARTLKMFARDSAGDILRRMEENVIDPNEEERRKKVPKIRRALDLLDAAWSGKQIDRRLEKYLRDHGYLQQ